MKRAAAALLIVLMLAVGTPVLIASNSSAAPPVVHSKNDYTLLPIPTVTIRLPPVTIKVPPVTIPGPTTTVRVPVPGPTKTVAGPTTTVTKPGAPGATHTVTVAPRPSSVPTATVTAAPKTPSGHRTSPRGTVVVNNRPAPVNPFDNTYTTVEKGITFALALLLAMGLALLALYGGFALGYKSARTDSEQNAWRALRASLFNKKE